MLITLNGITTWRILRKGSWDKSTARVIIVYRALFPIASLKSSFPSLPKLQNVVSYRCIISKVRNSCFFSCSSSFWPIFSATDRLFLLILTYMRRKFPLPYRGHPALEEEQPTRGRECRLKWRVNDFLPMQRHVIHLTQPEPENVVQNEEEVFLFILI